MLLHKTQSIGLDIADRSIAVVALTETDDSFELTNRGRIELPSGVVERGIIKDEKRLSDAVRDAFAKAELDPFDAQTEIVFALPESQVYFHFFDLPMERLAEREELVRATALNSIPLSADDLLYSYKILSENNQKMEILMTAASRKVAATWRDFFGKIKLSVSETFDIEALAVRRGLFLAPPITPVCVIDIGAVTTGINIFDAHGLRYAYSVLAAGDTFTHEIAKVMKISWEEAENLKISLGLSKENNSILSTLVKTLEPVRDEIKTALNYFKDKTGERISEIILVGGSSQLKGLVDYLAINLDLPVRLGEPVIALERRPKLKGKTAKRSVKSAPLEANNDFYYIEAIGLARRALPGWWGSSDPSIVLTPLEEAAGAKNILARVEQTIKKEEVAIEGMLKRIWHRKVLLFMVLVIVVAAVFGYWLYGRGGLFLSNTATSPNPSINREVTSLVFPESQLENTTPGEAGQTQNQPVTDGESTLPNQPAPPPEPEPTPPESGVKEVLITQTPTGWLNVRAGPGTTYPILTKVYPGQSYPLLQEAEKWYKIKVDLNTEGWVIDQYAAKQ